MNYNACQIVYLVDYLLVTKQNRGHCQDAESVHVTCFVDLFVFLTECYKVECEQVLKVTKVDQHELPIERTKLDIPYYEQNRKQGLAQVQKIGAWVPAQQEDV